MMIQDDPNAYAMELNERAKFSWRSFHDTGDPDLLNNAIVTLEEAIHISQDHSEERVTCLINLGIFLSSRAKLQNSFEDITASVNRLRRARNITPPHLKSTTLLNLGNSLQELFSFDCEQQEALREAASVYKEALAGQSTESVRPKLQSGISAVYLTQYAVCGSPSDLEQAISYGKSAIDSATSHSHRSTFLDTLSCALCSSYRHNGNQQRLDLAIQYGREAVMLAEQNRSPDLPLFYTNLADSMLARSLLGRNQADLDTSIELLGKAKQLVPGDQLHAGYRTLHYARALQSRFERDGSESDIMESVNLLEGVLDGTSPDGQLFGDYQSALAHGLIRRNDVTGSLEDLDRAVKLLKEAARHASGRKALTTAVYQNLGVALLARFEARGSYNDLEAARTAFETSLEQETEGSPNDALPLVGLANVALRVFQETDDLAELDESVSRYDEALSQPGVFENLRRARLASLGYALQLRYGCSRVQADFDRVRSFTALAKWVTHYLQKYQADTDNMSDITPLTTAISHLEEAVSYASQHPAAQVMFLNNLGLSYQLRYTQDQHDSDRGLGLAAYHAAMNVTAGSPLLRMTAAYRGLVLAGRSDMISAVEFVDKAVEVMPRLSPRTLRRADQQHMLSLFSGIGSYGAAVLLENERPPLDVVRALETTRGVMNSMLMDVRTDVDSLAAEYPEFAEKFTMARDQLGVVAAIPLAVDTSRLLHRESEAHIVAAKDFDAIVHDIRRLPGFQNFMQPATEHELMGLASSNPIVMINVSVLRSDALIITATGIQILKLSKLRLQAMVEKSNALTDALHRDTSLERQAINECFADVLDWLWKCVVQDVHHALSEDTHGLIRVCWIPVGPMALLPLHAAADSRSHANALDLIVSSYATTLKELQYARTIRTSDYRRPTALIAHLEETPNQPSLKHAYDEANAVLSALKSYAIVTMLAEPTKHETLVKLANSTIVHFSCHGFADSNDPSASKILLQDWESDPLTVADIAALHLRGSQLAYLSACHAAVGRAADLLDEGIHLAGAFQIAGFPRVIGTLWQVDDERAMQVAKHVYQAITSDGGVDFEKLPYAVHSAVRQLRSDTRILHVGGMTMELDEDDPFVWASVIYMGN
ncbi:hypothetical protein LTR56_005867 [Elasticomyces elasticus]|nr:hypothetical protein LTR56_005867 [Elasticomyces elasticus]KAK5756431.1 hypothetical protein LTS12_013503 [Elasticomyces elasticus]